MMSFRSTGFALLMVVMIAAAANAQTAQRTFVSAGSGNDANPCSRSAPCRNFGAAIAQTSAGGEIIVLDSGGYGVVTISKAVSIIAPPGLYAGVTGFSGEAMLVSAGASDVVVIRGLSLNGLGALYGIRFIGGAALHASGLDVSKFNVSGIHFVAAAALVLSDSRFRGNGAGVLIDTNTGAATASIERAAFERNVLYGLEVRDNATVAIRHSVSTGADNGLVAAPESVGGTAVLDIENCMVVQAFSGIKSGGSGGTATIRVSNSTITGNDTGLVKTDPSTLLSRGNNTVEGNNIDGTFTATFAPK